MNQIEKLLQKYRAERDRLDWLIQTLEAEIGQKPSVTKGARSQRRQSGASTVTFAKQALQANIHGLMIPALLAEMKKLGYESRSKNEANNLNSILHREGLPFQRTPMAKNLDRHGRYNS